MKKKKGGINRIKKTKRGCPNRNGTRGSFQNRKVTHDQERLGGLLPETVWVGLMKTKGNKEMCNKGLGNKEKRNTFDLTGLGWSSLACFAWHTGTKVSAALYPVWRSRLIWVGGMEVEEDVILAFKIRSRLPGGGMVFPFHKILEVPIVVVAVKKCFKFPFFDKLRSIVVPFENSAANIA